MEIPEGMITHEIEADMRYYEQSMAKSGGTLASYLKKKRKAFIRFREPGGSKNSEKIRK